MRRWVPRQLAHYVREREARMRAILEAPERIARLETMLHESHEQLQERSKRRWRAAAPDEHLTFRRALTGDAFVEKAAQYGVFGEGRAIVEVGPGYGRLLEAALRHGVPFARWTGVDLSERNVAHLRERFAGDDRLEFLVADAERVELAAPADGLVSSLTLKHLYPSFEGALANLAGQLSAGATIAVDLLEGDGRSFRPDGETYVRWYTREDVTAIFERCDCTVTAFDEVAHDADHVRLLVIGRR